MNNTETDLQQVSTGETGARLKETAFAMQTMQEGHPEIAQLFLEAAGAETIHGISHLQVAGGITIGVNLREMMSFFITRMDNILPVLLVPSAHASDRKALQFLS